MNSITHIFDSINNFSSLNFIFSQYIETFRLLKDIPSSVSFKLNDNDFIYHLSEAAKHIDWLNAFFKDKINPLIKKEFNSLSSKDRTIPYADFTVDKPPVFRSEPFVQLSFEDILKDNSISPVKRRKPFSFEGTCPFCGAPKEYIYDNNKGKGQYQCKACRNTFTAKTTISDTAGIYCPYCNCRLVPHHDRNGYIVYKCQNYKCSYYRHNLELVNQSKTEKLKTSSNQYLLHYHYRDFKFDLESLRNTEENMDTKVNLSRIHFDSKVLGLVLTYYVNYGLSSRKTALILKQVHGLKISHQTVLNYAASVSAIVKPLIDKYPYRLSNVLCGDETYIKVRGKNHYVFFFSDPNTKIITSYTIFDRRDTECACKTIYNSLSHYESIPEDMTIIADGNPIYNAAQIFFGLHDIRFDLHQVIGVKNKDDESRLYRPFKQVEERLNRTYKQNYYGTNGYDRLECANTYMVLFVCFFNFLRQHSSLGYNTPVNDNLFEENMLMQDQWLKLIELSEQYHIA